MPDDPPDQPPPADVDPPRPRPRAERADDHDDRPRRRRDDYEDDYDDDYDDLPRRRRRDDEGDGTGGLIPYKNGMALASYYCGVFALIPCVGAILGPVALVLGILGLKHAKRYPASRGQAHAWVGIVLGVLTALFNIGLVVLPFVLGFVSGLSKK